MSISTKTTSGAAAPDHRWLIGRLSEHRELQGLLAERPGLLIIEADPMSGTTGLLAHLVSELAYPAVSVDARGAADAMDLAMKLADAAVDALAPQAASWWRGGGLPGDVEGLRLSRALSGKGIDVEDLQLGSGAPLDRLREAPRLATALVDDDVLVVIDHLDALLESLGRAGAVELLGALRAERQAAGGAHMLLVGRPRGPLARALRDGDHPLYRAGQSFAVRRAAPRRFVEDLAIARPWTDVPVDLIAAAAELAAGAPACTWRVVDLASGARGAQEERALAGWRRLRELTAPQHAAQFELLGSAHRLAPTLVSAIATGLAPYGLPANDKSVRDALERLRSRGVAWAPHERAWAVADPLLAAWTRDHAPSWVERRSRRGA